MPSCLAREISGRLPAQCLGLAKVILSYANQPMKLPGPSRRQQLRLLL